MTVSPPATIYLIDYAPTDFIVAHLDLSVCLDPQATRVESRFKVRRRPGKSGPLVLDGEELTLLSVVVNGASLSPFAYRYADNRLTFLEIADEADIRIVQSCNPSTNTVLSGLYLSNNMYCTQMEAQGFRRFAFFYDRPDVMVTYRVRIEAPTSLPVLLSNGNPGGRGNIPETDKHFAIWDDPHPKPTYLFALVGGDLAHVEDSFTTIEQRHVRLGIYVEKGKQDRCGFAMEALKLSMAWDEEHFGRAYDLDHFNIVAVSDFNMGAMENKGLNIFNDKYVLARPDTATDQDFVNIERIIAHEYFHNWTGNRITCRDWFQLCLKEGLTVYRDQEFTSDVRSRAVKRIEDVKTLRARQFPEDQGPLAHPVRPASYIEINNFYTPTVYEKGAEICRMMHTLIGADAFRRAMDIYFDRHDGDAATVEDFLRCMAEASGRDLSQFAKWYDQAGTPILQVEQSRDAVRNGLKLTLRQRTPATPGQVQKEPLHIPVRVGLVGADGVDLPLIANGAVVGPVFELREEQQTFDFEAVPAEARLSINRGFSAPVILQQEQSDDDLLFLMARDSDSFNRWEAAQTLGRKLLLRDVAAHGAQPLKAAEFVAGLGNSLEDPQLDDAFKALMLQLPPEAEIAAAIGHEVDADAVQRAREGLRHQMSAGLLPSLRNIVARTTERGTYSPDPTATARRSLRYGALSLLAKTREDEAFDIARADIAGAGNMTAEMGSIAAVLDNGGADGLLVEFYDRHHDDHLLLDKWFLLQAQRQVPHAASHVEALTRHKDFRFTTPNRVYALIGGFFGGNFAGFHAADGGGYRLLADCILRLDGINPQVASRLATGFRSWRLFHTLRRDNAENEMTRILAKTGLSPDVYEIISRTLQNS